jgi:hypothetical protein
MGGTNTNKDLNKREKEAQQFIYKNANAQKRIYLSLISRISFINLYSLFGKAAKKS